MYRIQRTDRSVRGRNVNCELTSEFFVELQVDESGNSRYRMNECIWSDEDTGTKSFPGPVG